MRDVSIICSGYVGSFLSDYKNYEEQIRNHEPMENVEFDVSHIFDDSFLAFSIQFGKESFGMYADIGANVTDDIIAWLESICLGYSESFLLLDAEGPPYMFRFYSYYGERPRFSILDAEANFHCDILIDKKEFVNSFWNAIQAALKKTPGRLYRMVNAELPVRRSIIIRNYLKKGIRG